MSYQQDSCAKIESFEGRVPWLYRDTRGNITVGVGKMLATLDAALALPFQISAPGEFASAEEIANDWNRVMAMPFGQEYAASYYRSGVSCFLAEAEIDALLLEVVQGLDQELGRGFAGWAAYPDEAHLALLDMGYNLGIGGLFAGYPRMCMAVRAKAWEGAAAECARQGIPQARNDWTRQMFEQCAEISD